MEFDVGLDPHHLEELAARPTTGILELIWNALDADATEVDVSFGRNDLNGIEEIRVVDNGHGMTQEEAENAFSTLGGSWKLTATRSRSGERVLHGKHGRGRFRGAGVGQFIRWETVAEHEGERLLTTIEIRRSDLRHGVISEGEPTERPVGTKVAVGGIGSPPEGINESTADRLLAQLALYIEQYHPVIRYAGAVLDPGDIQTGRASYSLSDEEAQLDVIEWERPFDRALYLCNPDGMAIDHVQTGIHAPGFDFTAYLRWVGFADEKRALTAELDAESNTVIEEARDQLRTHFRGRAEETRRTQVEEWKSEDVYPYREEATSSTEEAARELFDVVAVTARDAVNAAETRGRRFSLRLLQQAIEQDPGSLRRVLQEVLELPEEKLEELDELLSQTTLASVISVSRSITNRLDFLRALEEMVFEPEARKRVLERKELHRIVANETWVFGEEFALAVDDESLRTALKRHIEILGRAALTPEELAEPVVSPSGQEESILDLMLARLVPQSTQRREHLVVELKRPAVKIGPKEAQQIREYALAVARDPRFEKSDVHWDFIAVSTELQGTVVEEAAQPHLPKGQIASFEDDRIRVWAKTWGDIIEDANHRLKFVQEHLGYDPSAQQAFKYLRERHAEFVPSVIAEKEIAETSASESRPDHSDAPPGPRGLGPAMPPTG